MAVACRRQKLLLFQRYTAHASSAPLRLCPPLLASSALPSILQQRQRPFASSASLPPESSGSPRPDPPKNLSATRSAALRIYSWYGRLLQQRQRPPESSGSPSPDPPKWYSWYGGLLGIIVALTSVGSVTYSFGSLLKGHIPAGRPLPHHFFIEREEEAQLLVSMMDFEKCFIVVKGYPGCGKTSLVCDVARKRGSAAYVDAAAACSFDDVEKKVNENYQHLFFYISYFICKVPSTGFETFNLLSWVVKRLPGGQPLVVIVDHVHKLKAEDILRLVSWAKTSADMRSVHVILIGSDLSQDLTGSSDAKSRALVFEMDHPSPQQVRDALQKYAKANPERIIDTEELLYMSGGFPSLLFKLLKAPVKNMKIYLPDMKYKELWYALLIAGPNGLAAEEAQNSWSDAIFHLDGVICTNETLYYKSGLHRDAAAKSLLAKFNISSDGTEQRKEVEKAMMTRTYEAYRSSVF